MKLFRRTKEATRVKPAGRRELLDTLEAAEFAAPDGDRDRFHRARKAVVEGRMLGIKTYDAEIEVS